MLLVGMVVACDWGGADAVRSVPAEPLVDLAGEGPLRTTMVWSDLAELFPTSPGIPRPLEGLKPGSPAEEARTALMASRREGEGVHESELAKHPTLSTVFRHGGTDVPVTVVLDPTGTVVHSVDLDIEWPAASSVLLERWGDPLPGAPMAKGRVLSRWAAPHWSVELHRLPEGMGILHYGALTDDP